MARKWRPLSIDTHIGLGNTAKNFRNRLVKAFVETTDKRVRGTINRMFAPLEIFKCEMDAEICKLIPRTDDPSNLAIMVYYGANRLTDEAATELQRMEASLKQFGFVCRKSGGGGK